MCLHYSFKQEIMASSNTATHPGFSFSNSSISATKWLMNYKLCVQPDCLVFCFAIRKWKIVSCSVFVCQKIYIVFRFFWIFRDSMWTFIIYFLGFFKSCDKIENVSDAFKLWRKSLRCAARSQNPDFSGCSEFLWIISNLKGIVTIFCIVFQLENDQKYCTNFFLSDNNSKKKNPSYRWNETCPLSWQKAHKNATVSIIIIVGGCFILFNGMSFLCFCLAYICIWCMAIESNVRNIVVNLCDSSRWFLSTFFSIKIAFEASAHRAYYIQHTLLRSKFRMKLINRFGG